MERAEIKSIIESLIFVSEEPISVNLMAMVFEEIGIKKGDIKEVLAEIVEDYNNNPDRGLYILETSGGYQFRTKAECAEWIRKLNVPKPIRLSQPALETLAIIAYRQPILRSDVESIRGVDSGGVIKTLLERGLIKIIGKSEEAGRPLVYATTPTFLELFSLKDLKDLPTLKEIEDLEVSERVGVLGKEETGETVAEGVSEVIAEYKEEVSAYVRNPEEEEEDQYCIDNLEDSIKNLRKLEKVIFPKPKEEIKAVPKEGQAVHVEGGTEPVAKETQDEGTPPQDTSPTN